MPAFLLGEHEYTLIRITGQSFMLHQIRKMIGLMLAILKGYTQEDIFDLVFQRERVSNTINVNCVYTTVFLFSEEIFFQ
ncbi:unnamed protein product [Trichobilharzia regenti]|nr:unnamed protein product [Trichobilharzia regenti]